MSNIRLEFKVLIYREDNWWIAHCLEMDLAEEGDTAMGAFHNLLDVIGTQVDSAMQEGDLQSIFSSAPPELWRMYATAKDKTFKKKPPKPVNRVDVRELVPA